MKSFLSRIYFGLGSALGFDASAALDNSALQRTPEQMEQARRAFQQLRKLGDDLRKAGITGKEVQSWIREGRR